MARKNTGVTHAADTAGGVPLCGNRKAHMSTTVERFLTEEKQCKRCAAKVAKSAAGKAARAKTVEEEAQHVALKDISTRKIVEEMKRRARLDASDPLHVDLNDEFWAMMSPTADQAREAAEFHDFRVHADEEFDEAMFEAGESAVATSTVTQIAAEAAHARTAEEREFNLGRLKFALERECNIYNAHTARMI